MDTLKTLLAAERRGRAYSLTERYGPGTRLEIIASSGPDGMALRAAARWAARLGAEVTVQDGREDRVNGLTARLPDAMAAWRISLADSAPMVAAAGPNDPVVTCEQARAVDRLAIQRYGVPGVCLMENAAIGATAVAMARRRPTGWIAIVAGGGNNAGDGFAMARGFAGLGVPVAVALLKPAAGLKGDALANYRLIQQLPEIHITAMDADASALPAFLDGCGMIVDALLGTGFTGDPSPVFRRAIDAMNASPAPTLALDIPSGLNGDSGQPSSAVVQADATVTFAAIKAGLVVPGAVRYVGDLFLADIGAPSGCYPPAIV